MSGDNHTMQLRPRRSVLGDISNRASLGGIENASGKSIKKNKRLRASLEGGDDDVVILTKRTNNPTLNPSQLGSKASALSTSSSSSVSSGVTLTSLEPETKKKRRSSSGSDVKQEILPIHIIRRSLPLHISSSNPSQCLDTIDRMYNIYYEIEEQFSAKPYMSKQRDINQKMRSILIDWLIEVHHKFKLQPQTLWLSINILDRYLEKVQILRSRLQLVGVSALLIASKFEEIYPPEVKDCVYITDHAYERQEVLAMETSILTTLEYKVSIPTGYHFLIRYLNCIQASERTRNLASYYAERNLQESDMLLVRPHKFAAASVYAALKQQNCEITRLSKASIWTRALQEESGLTESDLKPCARTIIRHVGEESETASKRHLVATKKKYSTDKFAFTSSLSLPHI